jgi:hypothetical protein
MSGKLYCVLINFRIIRAWCGRFYPIIVLSLLREHRLFFIAYPLRGLNEIMDPSKATFARPRKLGLRPQTCTFALRGATLGQDGCPKISQDRSVDMRGWVEDANLKN